MVRLNVLSLFDGMSGGQIALRELGVTVNKYYASEIDKFAIAQTQFNFPDTIQLGDVERWREWDIDWAKVDLLLAGSPCQGFSFAGKQLAFSDPRSRLFFVFVDILNHIRSLNPDVKFLLENVNMKRDHLRVISEYCGVFPVRINSNLVSAQNRDRYYWTNIRTKQTGLFGEIYSDIPQPEDRGIFLRDILEEEVGEKYYLSENAIKGMLRRNEHNQEVRKGFRTYFSTGNDKSNTILGRYYKDGKEQLICVAMRGRETGQELEPNYTGKTNCLTSAQKDNPIMQLGRGKNKGGVHSEKAPTLSANTWEQNNLLQTDCRIRRLTPDECAKLQTIPFWYLWTCSNTQQYRMLGNGWSIAVIVHILKYLLK